MSNNSEAERCPELWFPDGNLVFRAENMLFRVYRGVLASKSTVFADMLAIPQPNAEDGETFEGCPFVALTDSAVDVRRFLGVLHDSDYYDEHCKNDNSAIFSILCLATKYDVALLRKRLLAHFTEAVPQSPSLSQWDAASKRRASVGSITCAELDIIAVKVARELDVPALLPCALFRCALGPLDSIAHGVTAKDGRHFQLDAQDKQACFVAREHVREIVYGRLAEWSYPNDEDWETSCSSRSCRGAVTYVMTQLLGNRARMESCCFLALDDHLLEIQKSFAKTICSVDTDEEKTCEEVFRDQWDTTRSNVWNHVPSFFGFVDWRTVQAASDIV